MQFWPRVLTAAVEWIVTCATCAGVVLDVLSAMEAHAHAARNHMVCMPLSQQRTLLSYSPCLPDTTFFLAIFTYLCQRADEATWHLTLQLRVHSIRNIQRLWPVTTIATIIPSTRNTAAPAVKGVLEVVCIPVVLLAWQGVWEVVFPMQPVAAVIIKIITALTVLWVDAVLVGPVGLTPQAHLHYGGV